MSQTSTPANHVVADCVQEAVHRLRNEPQLAVPGDRRDEPRYPFFRPVAVTARGRFIAALALDISSRGIRIVHNIPLDISSEVTVTIWTQSGDPIQLRSRIEWCEPWDKGWQLSGARFLQVLDA